MPFLGTTAKGIVKIWDKCNKKEQFRYIIIQANAGILSIGSWETNCSEFFI